MKKKTNCLLVGPVQVLNVFVINRFKWEVINMKTPIEQSQAEFTKYALNETGVNQPKNNPCELGRNICNRISTGEASRYLVV